MMNPNTISTETSTGQQGLSSKGKKETNSQHKGLFSRLLASLQGNEQHGLQKKNPLTTEQNEATLKSASGHNQTLGQQTSTKEMTGEKIKANLILQAPDKKLVLSQGSENKTTSSQKSTSESSEVSIKLKHTTQKHIQLPGAGAEKTSLEVDTSAVIAVAQEPSIKLQTEQLPQAKEALTLNSKSMAGKNNKSAQPSTQQIIMPPLQETAADITTSFTEPKLQHKTGQTVVSQATITANPQAEQSITDKQAALINPKAEQAILTTAINSKAEQPITNNQMPLSNPKAEQAALTTPVNPKVEQPTTNHQTPLSNPKTEQAVLTTPVNPKAEQSTAHHLAAQGVNIVEEVANPQRAKTRKITSETNKPNTHIGHKKNNPSEPLDVIRNPQAAVVSLQQRTSRQAQGNNIALSTQNSSSIITRTFDQRDTSSQQDFLSNQHHMEQTLLDASKTDAKNSKNIDFQAQLAYRSQRTFTPANTMLEIVRSAKDGKTTLELQLEPANLGKVHVSIQMDLAKQIQVSFTVDQAASRQALEQHMPQLRLALAQQGLDLGGFSMQMNQQQSNQQGNSGSTNTSSPIADNSTTASALPDDNNSRIGVNLASNGHLNIMA